MQDVIRIEKESRNHNIVIFGLKEIQGDIKWDTCYRVLDLFASELNLDLHEQCIDNVYWLGKRRSNRPLLVKFMSVMAGDLISGRIKMLTLEWSRGLYM